MNILIANDDGVFAPGIQALATALKPLGRIVVVAPDRERSGFSSALTLDSPLRPIELEQDVWSVNGTPADCIFLATHGLFDFEFDLVVSGINSGANLGDDVLYSGTVGAALEGRNIKCSAIAVSLVGPKVRSYSQAQDYAVAAKWIHDFIAQDLEKLPANNIWNINIPDVLQIKGVKLTHQGQKQLLKPITKLIDPKGKEVYWIGLAGTEKSSLAHQDVVSDFCAISNDYISITPIQADRTNYTVLEALQHQFEL